MASERGHETLEHTADVGLRVWAPTLEELFSEASVGLVGVMGKADGPEYRREVVRLDAPDLDALFVDWLSEVLFMFEARKFVVRSADVSVALDPCRLEASMRGADASSFVQQGPAVKAITFHGLEIRETSEGYEARVYLDV